MLIAIFFATSLIGGFSQVHAGIGADANARVATKFRGCNGSFRSPICRFTMQVNGCKNSIQFQWLPLKMPGSKDWAEKRRNFCSVKWDAIESVEERKFPPEKCDQIVQTVRAVLKNDRPNSEAKLLECNALSERMGFLKFQQNNAIKSEKAGFFATVDLEDMKACKLHNKNERVLSCPQLSPRLEEWAKKLMALIDTKFDTLKADTSHLRPKQGS